MNGVHLCNGGGGGSRFPANCRRWEQNKDAKDHPSSNEGLGDLPATLLLLAWAAPPAVVVPALVDCLRLRALVWAAAVKNGS